LVGSFAERDLHDVLVLPRNGFAARHTNVVTELPPLGWNVVAALAAHGPVFVVIALSFICYYDFSVLVGLFLAANTCYYDFSVLDGVCSSVCVDCSVEGKKRESPFESTC
jgi:hypothetical protein